MKISNQKIAELLRVIADIYEAEEEDYFRVRAYRRASNSIKKLPYELSECPPNKDFKEIPFVGKVIHAQIKYILATGKIFLKNVQKEKPYFNELKLVRGLGPKRRKQLYKYNINTLKKLTDFISAGEFSKIENFGKKLEVSIKNNLTQLKKYEKFLKWFRAEPIITKFLSKILLLPGVIKVEACSEFRRKKELVGNTDIIIAVEKSKFNMDKIIEQPVVKEIIKKTQTFLSVILLSGLKVDIYAVLPDQYGACLLWHTGSKEHVDNLKNLIGVKKINFRNKSETEIYHDLHLECIDPELRENRGEILAAQNHSLPQLINLTDLKGDLHCHTNETDGSETLETMVYAAKALGHEYIAITDHSKRLAITHGMDEKRLLLQIKQIDELNSKLKNFYILKSMEVDILGDGSLDLSDDVLKELDLCVCSIHSQFNLSKKKQTERIIRAMDNTNFTILGHPTGRLIERRRPYEIDIKKILTAAKERGCFVELNAQPYRLDLKDDYCHLAKKNGSKAGYF